MAYSDYTYDPTAAASANLISNEVQTVDQTTTVAVFPLQGAFFGTTLVVETKSDSDAEYTEATLGTDYIFSPLFQYASAMASRKVVYSYIVLKPSLSDVTSVRLTYQCLGGYNDDALFAEINNSSFDQTDYYKWAYKIFGSGVSTGAVTRDPDVMGLSTMEVMTSACNTFLSYLENNLTNGTTLSQDLTRLEMRVGGSYTKEETETMRTAADKTATVTANANTQMYLLSKNYNFHEGVLTFISGSDSVQSTTVRIARSETQVPTAQQVNEINSSAGLYTLTVTQVGDDVQVLLTPTVAGTAYYKVKTEIANL